MQSFLYLLASCVFFTINAAIATELQPRGVIASLDQPKLLLGARDPQSETYCDGTTCGASCVPFGYLCCADGGGGCPVSSDCVPNGCCPHGTHCVGGGGTITYPGGIGPAPTFSDDSTPANTAPAGNSAAASSFDPASDPSTDAYESFLATAYPSTASAGGAAAASTPGFPNDGLSSSTTSSFSFSQLVATSAALPSATAVSGGSSSGGSASGGSSSSGSGNKASGATEAVSKSTVLSGLAVLAGLLLVQML